MFSSTIATNSWFLFIGLFLIIIYSSVSGFSTISIGAKERYYNTNNKNRRSRFFYDCDGAAVTIVGQHPASTKTTALQFSFSPELPAATDMISTYTYCLKYHYFPTQSVTNAILTVVGDGLAQTHEENQRLTDGDRSSSAVPNLDFNYYDPKRGLVYFFKGLGSGIMWAWWFDFAEVWSMDLTQSVLGGNAFQQPQEAMEFASSTMPSSDEFLSVQAQSVRTGINICLEQFLVCPILFSVWDIPLTSLMRGSPVDRLFDQIRQKLLPLLVANAKVWTLVNIVTYNIPLEYRLLFTSAASIVSETINSGITSKQVTTTTATTTPIAPKPLDTPLLSGNSIAEFGYDASLSSVATAMATVAPLSSGKNVTLLEFR
eukprot:CAMPEP_0116128048 /NCGR_PEP_ID=MMETSP0329-20121206/7155_1 /TAXON_ID=697910 /ORGANISM="Pseudo-nitzschia arenysensis, Strain B593" /LENGTH=372 /DNA_ID=CAMNT_0003622167 /DNA_START=159 /DNA_END=1277 /DNA_ORIENTATION=+